ncbi:tyrosine-type recombinase/integrase [Chitinophaga tropicalis]|uniref:Tyrosine-type recombinase/integrase n=1 Tax=Chitinophaga tropicalis TaxID=2683588 RepID=A0A7K1U966_9BACT|nr:tyrosine-type recombinase/integrase [Chitinophaga tropicalis]MVT10912.1 tyrosine-type recombinase/integrase [Chitinophaga tropicalis]
MSEVIHPVATRFLAYIQLEKRYSAHTFAAYQQDLTQFFTFIQSQYGDLPLPGISHSHVRTWLAWLMEQGIVAKSVNRKISTLKSFFKYALRQGEMSQTPMTKVTAPKIGKRLPGFIDEKGMQAVEDNRSMRRGQEDAPIFTADLQGMTHRLIFELLYHTGIRVSELVSLQGRHVDMSNLTIKVLGKGNKERIIPVSSGLREQIREYMAACRRELAEYGGEVLLVNPRTGKKLYREYVYNVVKGYLTHHQITTISKKSPHVLRHTFATHLTNNGADLNAVKELLGHASLASTQVYTHNSIEKLREAYRKAHPKGE